MIPILIFEIIISLFTLMIFIGKIEFHPLNVKYFIFEDLEASLISLDYANFTVDYICNITNIIIPSNYRYLVIKDTQPICGSLNISKLYELKHFVLYNGTIYNITIVIGK